jgi:hypothetical protein
LADDVFLVAAVVGQFDDLRWGPVGVGGDVEEVADLVEQDVVAAGAADVLAQGHHPVGALAFAGPVVEGGDVLVVEFEVEVSAFFDDLPFAVGAAGPGLAGDGLVPGWTGQPGPRRRVEPVGDAPQCRVVVHAKDEVDPAGPPVQVFGQGEVGVAA